MPKPAHWSSQLLVTSPALLVAAPLVAALLVAGCGGSTAGSGTGGSGTGGSGTAGSGTGGSGGSSNPGCPAAPPASGSACTVAHDPNGFNAPDADCTWGNDPRPSCRTTALCTNGQWQVTAPDPTACSTPPLAPSCPNPPPADTTICATTPNASCWYGDGTRCACSGCQGGTQYPICQPIDPPEWFCAKPAAGCPTVMPQAGAACSTPNLMCGPDCGLDIVCRDGYWRWERGNCPICAAPNTPIATPSGERPIAALRPGDLVYSVDGAAIVAVPLVRVGHTRVASHHVMRVTLENGRMLEVSPGHPTADGRTFAKLEAGTTLDGQRVVSSELVPYRFDATYDVLPASSTGTYFAAGALIGSTLTTR